jgi:UDP-2,4-diacetamido-2,4,6-trideoxy-beta-L-altropyranose hydrolase
LGGGTFGRDVTRRALLVADCGAGVGLGHLERILALADALRPDYESCVVLPEGHSALRTRVEDRGHVPMEVPGGTVERADTAVVAASPVDVVVLDGYLFDLAVQRRLRGRAPLTFIDDLCLPADCDLAVNPSPGGEEMRPSGAATFLGGAAYALLRASFLEAREAVLDRGSPDRTVLVSTGATDLDGMGATLSEQLLERDPTLEVVRVVGPDAPETGSDNRGGSRLLVAPVSLAGALASATLYAGAAGTTAVQAACVGIPAVITAAVPNQVAQAAALAGAGCAVLADRQDLPAACIDLLRDRTRRQRMAECGRNLVDGRGAIRVADAIRLLICPRVAR